MTSYFVHIHPFPDGNGRVSRILMQDYMARHGYLPAVWNNLTREDYIQMISDAQDGKPGSFVSAVLRSQLQKLRSICGVDS